MRVEIPTNSAQVINFHGLFCYLQSCKPMNFQKPWIKVVSNMLLNENDQMDGTGESASKF